MNNLEDQDQTTFRLELAKKSDRTSYAQWKIELFIHLIMLPLVLFGVSIVMDGLSTVITIFWFGLAISLRLLRIFNKITELGDIQFSYNAELINTIKNREESKGKPSN